MPEELDPSFAALNAQPWTRTLAYWIGTYNLADLQDSSAAHSAHR